VNMNVLHVNTWAARGGAGRAAFRLHEGLRKAGHCSRTVARRTVPGRADVQGWVPETRLWNRLRRLNRVLEIHAGLDGLADVASWVGHRRHAAWADVINLHNVHGGAMSLFLLSRLERRAPLVWTLHDMWALTGHCAYPMACDRWLTGCGRCPNLAGPPRIGWDATRLLYRARARIYRRISPVLVAPSRWLLAQTRRSSLTRGFRAVHIPNGLDLDVFRPVDRRVARSTLRLGPAEKVVMFCAQSLADRRKGPDLLIEALRTLHANGEAELRLLVAGQAGSLLASQSPYPVLDLGQVDSELLLAAAYSAADVFVLPTRMDNLPNGLVESIACGTPCVSFRAGGVPDVVRPGRTGWLAEPEDARDLARCLHEALNSNDKRKETSAVCRRIAEDEYDVRLMVERYLALYEELIEERRRSPGALATPE